MAPGSLEQRYGCHSNQAVLVQSFSWTLTSHRLTEAGRVSDGALGSFAVLHSLTSGWIWDGMSNPMWQLNAADQQTAVSTYSSCFYSMCSQLLIINQSSGFDWQHFSVTHTLIHSSSSKPSRKYTWPVTPTTHPISLLLLIYKHLQITDQLQLSVTPVGYRHFY